MGTAASRPSSISWLVLGGLGLILVSAAVGWFARQETTPPPPLPPPVSRPAMDSLDARLTRVRGALERLPEPTSDEDASLRRPQTPSYSEHLRMSDSLGIRPLRSEAALDAHVRRGSLVPLVDTEWYAVRILEHSKPFVRPLLLERLQEVGQRFHEALAEAGLPRYRYVISSALRTSDLQEDLASFNRNATSSRSSHEYGVSVDIVYTDYALTPSAADSLSAFDGDLPRAQRMGLRWTEDLGRAYYSHLFGAMARVLIEMQRDERLLVLLESEQPVFHITLATPAMLAAPNIRSSPSARIDEITPDSAL